MTLAIHSLPAPSAPPRDSDSLKDAEALAFLAGQPADVRAVWLERVRLLRWVDQLSERDRWGWQVFLRQWRHIEWGGAMPGGAPFGQQILAIERVVYRRSSKGAAPAFSSWLDALSADYGRSLVPETLEQHDAMVTDVGGFFRLFPYLTAEQWESIGAFGALDQAWNNVRDIAEDARAGRCYFPTEALRGFGLRRGDFLSGMAARIMSGDRFMSFWLGEHLQSLRARASAFLAATDLHPSVAALRSSCLRRYERIERVLRGVDWDYRAFPAVYEAEVKRELGEMALGAKEITT